MHKITKVSVDEVVKHNLQSDEFWKKQQEHMTTLEVRKTCLTTEVVELLKKNGKLLEAEKKDKMMS